MRSMNLTHFQLRNQLVDWLEISSADVPISLLIMSRAFNLSQSFDEPETIVASSLSALESEIINEAILDSISTSEESNTQTLKRKLESIKYQSELIEEESEEQRMEHQQKENEQKDQVPADKSAATEVSEKK